MADFGEIVDGTFVLSPEQVEIRKYGFSEIKASGIPTIYHAGDVVNLPYTQGKPPRSRLLDWRGLLFLVESAQLKLGISNHRKYNAFTF